MGKEPMRIHSKMILTLTREPPSLYNLKYGMKMRGRATLAQLFG